MNPGRDLDALVSEKVMGWKTEIRPMRGYSAASEPDWYYDALVFITDSGKIIEHASRDQRPKHKDAIASVGYEFSSEYSRLPRFSSDISAAWEVVEKLTDKGFSLKLFGHPQEYKVDGVFWMATFSTGHLGGVAIESKSAPHAICLAALKALGVDVAET